MEIVYVLTNPAMPGLVKIGKTSNADAGQRISQLYATGVPFPFKLEFACRVSDAGEVESALHVAFGPNRINPKREFFSIDVGQAIAILKLLHVDDATKELASKSSDIAQEEIDAGKVYLARRPKLNFTEMNIPQGAQLHFTESDAEVTVVGPRKVSLGGIEMSLTAATRQLLGLNYSVAPGPYWKYLGQPLRNIYDLTYNVAADEE